MWMGQMANVGVRSEGCWWLGWGASVFPTPAYCSRGYPGGFAILTVSLRLCFGQEVSSSLDLFRIVFSQLSYICQFLFLPSDAFNLTLWLEIYCLKLSAD